MLDNGRSGDSGVSGAKYAERKFFEDRRIQRGLADGDLRLEAIKDDRSVRSALHKS